MCCKLNIQSKTSWRLFALTHTHYTALLLTFTSAFNLVNTLNRSLVYNKHPLGSRSDSLSTLRFGKQS